MTSTLFIEITGSRGKTLYRITPHQPDPRVAVKAWRLTTSDGRTHDVSVCRKGWPSCTCEDSTYRERTCKHARSLIEHGLLPEVEL